MTSPTGGPAVDTVCAVDDEGCLTCGDVAAELTVVATADGDARCVDDAGAAELVATDLVGPVAVGDRLLVHARVAIAHLGGDTS